jgi:hypothetical protein
MAGAFASAMFRFAPLLFALASSACATTPTAGIATIRDLDWMGGCWESADNSQHERWMPLKNMRREGEGWVARDGKIVFSEKLRLEQTRSGVTYWAAPNGAPFTPFTLTESGPGSAVFENPAHDSPKLIRYRREGERLRAWVGDRTRERLVLDARLSGCD